MSKLPYKISAFVVKGMIVDLPHDVQHHVFDVYKTQLKERYESSAHYILDMLSASCGQGVDILLQYMKRLLQRPLKKPSFALVLTGECSTAVSRILCRIAGDGNYIVGDRGLLGRFNGQLKDKHLLVIEGRLTERLLHEVKGVLSSPTIMVEGRWQNAERVPSHHHVVLVSSTRVNDGARRFSTVECSHVDGLEHPLNHQAIEGLIHYLAK